MDDELLRCFEAGEVPPGGFHHEQHVRVAWNYVSRLPLPEARARFTSGLKRFALAQGKPNLYHETITIAYLLLINERVDRTASLEWEQFAAQNADLLRWKPSVLDRYYSPEILSSDRAREIFVEPDRKTIESSAVEPSS